MLDRRSLLLASGLMVAPSLARAQDFTGFLAGLRAEAKRAGISDGILNQAFANIQPNQKVLDLDRHQPEFTQTWTQYRSGRLSDTRILNGRQLYAQNRTLVQQAASSFRVTPAILMGIWGLESNYGGNTGGFNVIEALATLAWEGRRAAYFRSELIAALRILDHGDISVARMTGSYAGAMGQPQFMPSSFGRFAVDFDGDGRRDIWDDKADVLASMANYLSRSGWREGESWGVQVALPGGFDPNTAGRQNTMSVAAWQRMGVRPVSGPFWPRPDATASVIIPDGDVGGDAFLTTANFLVIRRYNPSDFYALAVGLLGDLVTA